MKHYENHLNKNGLVKKQYVTVDHKTIKVNFTNLRFIHNLKSE